MNAYVCVSLGHSLWASLVVSVCLYLSVPCPCLLPVSLAEKGDRMGTLRSGGGGGSGWLSVPAGPGGVILAQTHQAPCGMCASRHRLRAFCPAWEEVGGCRELETGKERWGAELRLQLWGQALSIPRELHLQAHACEAQTTK